MTARTQACREVCQTEEAAWDCASDSTIYMGPCEGARLAVSEACANLTKYQTACQDGLVALVNAHCIAPKGVDAGDGG